MILEFLANIRLPTALCIVAGLVSVYFYRKLTFSERFIISVIYLNILADLLAQYLATRGIYNGDVYNLICPLEKVIILAVYYQNTFKNRIRKYYIIGVIAIIFLSSLGYIFNKNSGSVHIEVYLISGFVIAILSYLQLRQMALENARASTPIFWFGMANLIYYTFMISSISASPLALTISEEFARQILLGNDIGYISWSIITTTGIAWKQTKI